MTGAGRRALVIAALAAAPALAAGALLADEHAARAAREQYAPLSHAEPAFEPRVVEPLVDPPDVRYGYHNTFGYAEARHNPGDDSVTITYSDLRDDQLNRCLWPFCGAEPGATGASHTQTYRVNQTFAYVCSDFEDHTKVYLYQYRGTGEFRGNPSFVFVHFEMEIPGRVPCAFPDYLVHTVDIYDAGWFDAAYDLDFYRGAPEGAGGPYLRYAEPVRYAVPTTPLYVDPYPVPRLGTMSYEGWITGMALNPDGSITVSYADLEWRGGAPRHVPGTGYERTYLPGQSFLAGCKERPGSTEVNVYAYMGSRTVERYGLPAEVLVMANFKGYTRAPMPCDYPGAIAGSVDAFDAGALHRQYDIEGMT